MNQEQLDNNYKVYKEIMAKIKKTSKYCTELEDSFEKLGDRKKFEEPKYKKALKAYDEAEQELEDFVDTLTDEEAEDIDRREGLTTIAS